MLAAAVVVVALVAAYWQSFRFLVDQWNRDPNYSYGFFVIPIAAMIFWSRREMIDRPGSTPGSGGSCRWRRCWSCGTSSTSGTSSSSRRPRSRWSPPGWCWPSAGWHLLRAAYPSLIFLFFMLPLPQSINQMLSQPLQKLATAGSVALLQVLGMPVMAEGNVIIIGATPLEVARACNGLSMLLSFVTLIAAVVFLVRRPAWERVVLMLSAVPIALVSNILRITVTAVCYHRLGQVTAEKFMHDFAGWMMMPLALVMVWLELRLMSWLFVEVEEIDARGR